MSKSFSTGLPDFTDKKFVVGDRVMVEVSNRTGTIVGGPKRHAGWKVAWDEPVFGVTESWVRTVHLTHCGLAEGSAHGI